MTKLPILRTSLLFLFVTSCLTFKIFAMTSTEEEMQVLNLFYKAKELVVSATHYPKPISQVAENISVVTAKEIKAMNAHSVAEVLNRIPGVFLAGYDRNVGATGQIEIQGSSNYHALVLLDGIQWNNYSGGNAVITDIPVGIVDRIEVIKGPASSTWGSSLGGVINIITKSYTPDKQGQNSIYASYGERHTSDLRAEWSQALGDSNFYLFANRVDSDGLRAGRSYERNSFYGKVNLPLNEKVNVGLTAGYSKPELSFGEFSEWDFSSSGEGETAFATAFVNTHFTHDLSLKLTSHLYKNTFYRSETVLTGDYWDLNDPGDILQSADINNFKWRSTGKLVWKNQSHTALLGVDYEHGRLKDKGYFAPGYGYENFGADPDIDKWAIYINDTFKWMRWAITPGIRYDEDNLSGGFTSPSLGITYGINDKIILRAIASRGFASPPVAYTSGSGLFLVPNPDLKPETITSYQIGMEAGFNRVWIKTTLFRHDVEDVYYKQWDALGPYMDMWINAGSATRQGCEVELFAKLPAHFSFYGGVTYIHHSPETDYGAPDQASGNVTLAYEKPDAINVRLMGHGLNWNEDPDYNGNFNDFLWDINIFKNIQVFSISDAEVFLTGYNIFNAALYDDPTAKNPRRWFECGMRMSF